MPTSCCGHGVEWFEIARNEMVDGGRALHNLDRVRADHPIVMHGVSMSTVDRPA
ncbi:MAG: DUF692 family protein [Hyphomicrobiales bacterium]